MGLKSIAFRAISLLTICSCNLGNNKNILLRLKYLKGSVIDIKYRSYIVTDNENDRPLNNDYIRMGLKVDSVLRDSAYLFSAKIDYVRFEHNGMLVINHQKYSSDEDVSQMTPEQKQIDLKLRPVINGSYKFSVNKNGKIIKPFSLAIDSLLLPVKFDFINLGIYQIDFPYNKIAIGDEWVNEQNIPGTKIKRKAIYKIESIYDSTIQIKVDGVKTDAFGNVNHFSGRYYLDQETCHLISCNIETKGELMETGGHGKAVVSIEAN